VIVPVGHEILLLDSGATSSSWRGGEGWAVGAGPTRIAA
jgi:hypothetical protein